MVSTAEWITHSLSVLRSGNQKTPQNAYIKILYNCISYKVPTFRNVVWTILNLTSVIFRQKFDFAYLISWNV